MIEQGVSTYRRFAVTLREGTFTGRYRHRRHETGHGTASFAPVIETRNVRCQHRLELPRFETRLYRHLVHRTYPWGRPTSVPSSETQNSRLSRLLALPSCSAIPVPTSGTHHRPRGTKARALSLFCAPVPAFGTRRLLAMRTRVYRHSGHGCTALRDTALTAMRAQNPRVIPSAVTPIGRTTARNQWVFRRRNSVLNNLKINSTTQRAVVALCGVGE
jgi:hypothetical protein